MLPHSNFSSKTQISHTDCWNFLVSACTHSISRYIYHLSNILRSQAKFSEVSTAWNITCSSEGRVVLFSVTYRWGIRSFFLSKRQGGPTKKYQNSPTPPIPPPPHSQENNVPSLTMTSIRRSSYSAMLTITLRPQIFDEGAARTSYLAKKVGANCDCYLGKTAGHPNLTTRRD